MDDAPPVSAGDQGKHVKNHPNNTDPDKSTWPEGETGVKETQEAWKNGRVVKPDGSVKVWDCGEFTDTLSIKEVIIVNQIVQQVRDMYALKVPFYIRRYLDKNFWDNRLSKHFGELIVENLTDFNYSTCYSLAVNLQITDIRYTDEHLIEYLKEHEYFYRLLVQISVVAPYGMFKFERYFLNGDSVALEAEAIPYLPNHQKHINAVYELFKQHKISLLDDETLKLAVPGIRLELREGEASVYNCLFEDLASYYPY